MNLEFLFIYDFTLILPLCVLFYGVLYFKTLGRSETK